MNKLYVMDFFIMKWRRLHCIFGSFYFFSTNEKNWIQAKIMQYVIKQMY